MLLRRHLLVFGNCVQPSLSPTTTDNRYLHNNKWTGNARMCVGNSQRCALETHNSWHCKIQNQMSKLSTSIETLQNQKNNDDTTPQVTNGTMQTKHSNVQNQTPDNWHCKTKSSEQHLNAKWDNDWQNATAIFKYLTLRTIDADQFKHDTANSRIWHNKQIQHDIANNIICKLAQQILNNLHKSNQARHNKLSTNGGAKQSIKRHCKHIEIIDKLTQQTLSNWHK